MADVICEQPLKDLQKGSMISSGREVCKKSTSFNDVLFLIILKGEPNNLLTKEGLAVPNINDFCQAVPTSTFHFQGLP